MRTGRRPILAAGNSNGDIPMLRFAQGSPRSLALLVHHDDADRGDAPYDTGAEEALDAASTHGFTVVSVHDDWSQVFPRASSQASRTRRKPMCDIPVSSAWGDRAAGRNRRQ